MFDYAYLSTVLLKCVRDALNSVIAMPVLLISGQSDYMDQHEFLGSVSFTGDFAGCLTFGCSQQCAEAMAVNMRENSLINASVDVSSIAVGKIVSTTMENVQGELSKMKVSLETSEPSVCYGQPFETASSRKVTMGFVEATIDHTHPVRFELRCKVPELI
jgi:CheY-specific phosphatase CheX